ncbi:MAG TPA: hypothetical protein VFT48_11255, partial [Pyrinomonadaceae bacterium]|nr:hypothetical protein [Pyrinomonadaceae bacterium]
TARLLKMIAPGAWADTFDQLFVPGVPVDKRALVKASGATAKVVELYMQRPGLPNLPMGPPSASAPALSLALEVNVGVAQVKAGTMTLNAMMEGLPEGTHGIIEPGDKGQRLEEHDNSSVAKAREARERAEFRENMKKKHGEPSPGEDDHHITPYKGGGELGDEARDILGEVGMPTSDAANGVRLTNAQRQTFAARRWFNSSFESHGNVHNQEDWLRLLEELRPVRGSRPGVERALQRFASGFF